MKRVITYGTYDLLHRGHLRLLERAKKLGDYLIVAVTSDNFDKSRGKINNQQTLEERIAGVRATGLADKIIVEEYEGQKIDDIKKYNVDVFTVGSDWVGKFDYLSRYCDVVYLERTQGVSSTEIRAAKNSYRMGLVGDKLDYLKKVYAESLFVNGLSVDGLYLAEGLELGKEDLKDVKLKTGDFKKFLKDIDGFYIDYDSPNKVDLIRQALEQSKDVLCETPVANSVEEYEELQKLAAKNDCVLMESIRTAYSTAYNRMLLLVESGVIGKVISVDCSCTSLASKNNRGKSLNDWGTMAMLPIFQVLGVDYKDKEIIVRQDEEGRDGYTQINFRYAAATATLRVAEQAKSTSDLTIIGTEGYVYVPAPWWKLDYFEIRYEDADKNRRVFYRLDGEGIRDELVAFVRSGSENQKNKFITDEVSAKICEVVGDFNKGVDVVYLDK